MPKLQRWFRHSIFGRLTEIHDQQDGSILTESCVGCFIMGCYGRLSACIQTSFLLNRLKNMKAELLCHPLKQGAIIIITAMMTSLFLSILLKKGPNTWIVMSEVTLAYVGCLGWLCDAASWPAVRESSLIFKMIRGVARWF